ncbi:MAG: NADPH-dependent 7-cyano-7-deazaguanine reductase QueF [Oleibacter sp.]|nr:NADPH-dependent 7-cyano-7-deazaguanine reductase QueF [Thalassolituus sp.]
MASVHSEDNPLGKASAYPDEYDAKLLYPIERDESWRASGEKRDQVAFYGVDIWNAYEVSWLNDKGKPVVFIAEFHIPATSRYLIESKSFKLYLNSFNQTRFKHEDEAVSRMVSDLSEAADGSVGVILHDASYEFPQAPKATLLDDLDVEITEYHPDANLLRCDAVSLNTVSERLVSHLLKSNCPVTGQPDWGSLYIEYEGQAIEHESLLAYIVSLRQHQDFHEQCVERTFRDIWLRCQPKKLIVYARYVRRGGLDINPMRSSEQQFTASNFRGFRQ